MAKLRDPVIEPSQIQACHNTIKLPTFQYLLQTSSDYVLFQKSFSVTTSEQPTNQPTFTMKSPMRFYRRMRRSKEKRSKDSINTDLVFLGL